MLNLPVAQPHFHGHAQEASNANAGAIADRRSAKAELSLGGWYSLHNLGERVHVDSTAEQAFPKDDDENDVNRRYTVSTRT